MNLAPECLKSWKVYFGDSWKICESLVRNLRTTESKKLDHDAWKSEILVDCLSLVGFEKVLAKKLLNKG